MKQHREPQFCETERTPEQRLDTVQWAFGVSASAGGAPSPELVQLYERYILGEIDMAAIGVELEKMYPTTRGDDPRYAPGQPTDRWYPQLDVAPNPPYKPLPADYDASNEVAEPAGPELPADECVAQLRAFVADIRQHVAEMPPRQPYTRLDV